MMLAACCIIYGILVLDHLDISGGAVLADSCRNEILSNVDGFKSAGLGDVIEQEREIKIRSKRSALTWLESLVKKVKKCATCGGKTTTKATKPPKSAKSIISSTASFESGFADSSVEHGGRQVKIVTNRDDLNSRDHPAPNFSEDSDADLQERASVQPCKPQITGHLLPTPTTTKAPCGTKTTCSLTSAAPFGCQNMPTTTSCHTCIPLCQTTTPRDSPPCPLGGYGQGHMPHDQRDKGSKNLDLPKLRISSASKRFQVFKRETTAASVSKQGNGTNKAGTQETPCSSESTTEEKTTKHLPQTHLLGMCDAIMVSDKSSSTSGTTKLTSASPTSECHSTTKESRTTIEGKPTGETRSTGGGTHASKTYSTVEVAHSVVGAEITTSEGVTTSSKGLASSTGGSPHPVMSTTMGMTTKAAAAPTSSGSSAVSTGGPLTKGAASTERTVTECSKSTTSSCAPSTEATTAATAEGSTSKCSHSTTPCHSTTTCSTAGVEKHGAKYEKGTVTYTERRLVGVDEKDMSVDWLDHQLLVSGAVFLTLLALAGALIGSRDVRQGLLRITERFTRGRRRPSLATQEGGTPLIRSRPFTRVEEAGFSFSD